MRVSKRDKTWLASAGTLGMSFTGVTKERTYYDGQMPVEETVHLDSTLQKLTRNFVGARGIEMMETTQNSATTQAYPLYDTHGNMVATLSKNSAGTSWSLGNERSYDVWGSVRSGAAVGGPKGRYVANLGHVQDDESGLIYMRARYYEPESGRFVSEDPARDKGNWYMYSSNDPVNKFDYSGKSEVTGRDIAQLFAFMFSAGGLLALGAFVFEAGLAAKLLAVVIVSAIAFAYKYISDSPSAALDTLSGFGIIGDGYFAYLALKDDLAMKALANGAQNSQNPSKAMSISRNAMYFYTGYAMLLLGIMFADAAS
ncbi:hypothetical protein CCB80_02120 [Armatimonadetes bacterium Uphvl-Ar1]|nr:hypothetical protein CCB80_01485 [Armatimonadetes bacterium Uphvl-Ar1]ARU39994.1 hypothetical protein CCB80_02120 [Armatimonadetes bacterium Uphvl-Ar1]